MRLAVIQRGEGLPPPDVQVRSLQPLLPDAYHIEDVPSVFATQRLVERLDGLARGDELCLVSLGVLPRGAGRVVRLLSELIARGVVCRTFDPEGRPLVLSQAETVLLRMLSEITDDGRGETVVAGGPPGNSAQLLSQADIQDIRRLHLAGMSPRRIGLIYRRSPKCIAQVVAHHSAASQEPDEAPPSSAAIS